MRAMNNLCFTEQEMFIETSRWPLFSCHKVRLQKLHFW